MIRTLLRSGLVLGIVNAAWSSLLGFLAIPVYLRHFGVEAYGLVGFAATLQGVLGLLDLGLTPAVNREVARLRALGDAPAAADAVHSMSWVFWPVSLIAGAAIALAAPAIAHDWIRNASVPEATVTTCVVLMGLTFAVRLPASIYNNALLGAGRLDLVSTVSLLTGTLSTGGTLALIAAGDIGIVGLFVWQGLVSVAMIAALVVGVLTIVGRPRTLLPSLEPLRRVWRFSVGMGLTAVVGVLFNYVDRVVLSGFVTLRAFGGYSLALAVAKLVTLIVAPTQQFLFPRLTALYVTDDMPALRSLYRTWAAVFACVLFTTGVFLSLYADPLVTLISGSPALGRSLPPTLVLLVWGTVLNGIMYFPYTLQMAFGRARLAAGIATGLLAGYIPVFVLLVRGYDMVGAATAWLLVNLTYLVVGTWLTHGKLLGETPWRWLGASVGVPLAYAAAVGGAGFALARAAGGGPLGMIAVGAMAAPITIGLFMAHGRDTRALVMQFASGRRLQERQV